MVEESREQIAEVFGARPSEVIFTSGGTEADNLAVKGLYWARRAAQGLGGFVKSSLFPPGVPWFMYILLTPIELLQVLVIRPATLAIRLMANMVSGHLMLALCFAATQYFVVEAAPALKAFGALTLVASLALTAFEVFVAALQAYIFVVLTAVYISLSVEAEH